MKYKIVEKLLSNSQAWPFCHFTLDIKSAARDLTHDYMSAEFDGVTYLMRA